MDASALQFLHRFNVWANRRLFEAAGQVSDAAEVPALRDMVSHIVAAEWIWLERLRGVNPTEVPAWVDAEELQALVVRLAGVEAEMSAVLGQLDDRDLGREVEFRFLNGTEGRMRAWQLILHLVNHSTYHRGQLARLLRERGIAPPATDLVFFVPESG